MLWTFQTFVSETGRNDVQDEIDGLSDEVLQHFSTPIRHLAVCQSRDWHNPPANPRAKKLHSVRDIYEIRFKARNVQYRPLGFFGPGEGQFTILVWCTKKGEKYNPSRAIDTAKERKTLVESGSASTRHLKIDGENFPPSS